MLRVFFEKTNEDTSVYFKDKQIWQCGDYYTKHQGQYPVIFLTFKDVKSMTWEETFQKIRRLISLEFIRHNELETSSVLTAYEKEQYHLLAGDNGDEVDCQMGLQLLSLLLHKHYGRECIIIIDEYDTPIQQGHTCNFYPEIVNFMLQFFLRRTQGQSTPCLWLSYRNTTCSKGKYLQRHEQSENLFYSR